MPDEARINWQLFADEAQQSIFKNPYVMQACNSNPNLRGDIRTWQQLWESGDAAGAAAFAATITGDEAIPFNAITSALMQDETHFNVGRFVLKRTLSISNTFTGALPDEENTEKLILTGAFTGLPGPIQTKINSIQAPPTSSPYLWSWRQTPSTMTTTAHNRTDVSTEWVLAQWNTNFYTVA